MSKHKSEDYKISAVQYHLEHNSTYVDTCKIFKCTERSLKRWIDKYDDNNEIKRSNRVAISYKITKTQVKEAIQILKQNEQITLIELHKELTKKFNDLDITPRQLGNVLRDNHISRKRTRHEHFPQTRYGKEINKQNELENFYKVVDDFDIRKIICLDETSISPAMIMEYSRCLEGQRCVIKTDDNFVFRKFTLLVAINNKKCVGYRLYEKGGITKERLNAFLQDFIYNKYKNNLIILDNAGSHHNNLITESIEKSNNKYLFSIVYTPKTNLPIEACFNQIKHYLKLNKKVLKYNELEIEVKNAINKVTEDNYKNYFNYAYRNKYIRQINNIKQEDIKKARKNYKD